MNDGVMDVVGRTTKCKTVGQLLINLEDDWLTVRLPSGRKLTYYKPLNEDHESSGRIKTTFMGVGFNRKFMRIDTYGGKLCENITQALARIVVTDQMLAADDYLTSIGGRIVL